MGAKAARFVRADSRPRWTSNRINSNVANAIVLGNQNEGSSWHASASLQKRFRQGFLKGQEFDFAEEAGPHIIFRQVGM